MKVRSPKTELFYKWYKDNEEILKGKSYSQIFKAFNFVHPDVYSPSATKKILISINKGTINEDSFQEDITAHFKPQYTQPLQTSPQEKYIRTNDKPFKVLIFSDPHGWLADLKALRCINKVLQKNRFDEVVINGDLVDLPYISRHTQKLFQEGILNGYTEVGEMEYTRDQILKPLRLSTDAKIRIRLGNHDERITKPNMLSDKQLQKLAILYKHYQTTKFEEMLGVDSGQGYIYDPADVHTYYDKFHLVHGLSLSQNASEKNIQEYMGSGSSGHTHRLGVYVKTNKKAPYVWLQSGHTRIGEEVEYFPTGKIPNWQQGFNVVTFYRIDGEMFFHWECTQIISGRCMYNGELFAG